MNRNSGMSIVLATMLGVTPAFAADDYEHNQGFRKSHGLYCHRGRQESVGRLQRRRNRRS